MLRRALLRRFIKKSCVTLEAEWTSKQNILIADTILAEPGPHPGFESWGTKYNFMGEGFLFLSYLYFIYLFVYSRHEVHSMNTHTLQNAG